MIQNDRKPHSVDIYVGGKLKLFRNLAGVTQTGLANSLGLTFQQVQKYEKGSNRISSSKLYEISKVLGREIPDFFEGLEDDNILEFPKRSVGVGSSISELLKTRDGLRLNRAFVQMEDKNVRRRFIALAESLVGIGNGDE